MRASQEITQQEGLAYQAWCQKHGVIADDTDNGNLVARYFQETWKEDVTEKNLDTAFEQLRPHLRFFEPNQVEYNNLFHALSAEEKAAFLEWKSIRGLKATFRNAVALLTWIKAHKFTVTAKNLDLAAGQQRVQAFLEWDDSATPRYADARQHADDGKGFMPKDEVNLTPAQHLAKARAAYAEPDKESVSVIRGREQASAKQDAESLRGRTHSETQHIQRVLVMKEGTGEVDWPGTRDARRQMQQAFERRNAVTNRSIR